LAAAAPWPDLNSNETGWIGNHRSQTAAQKAGQALWPPIRCGKDGPGDPSYRMCFHFASATIAHILLVRKTAARLLAEVGGELRFLDQPFRLLG
jgi:hypothetical protein